MKRGPQQIMDIDFPQNSEKPARRFTKENYYIHMKNGEKVVRSWLVYSLSADRVFCFCCVLFGKRDIALAKNGFNKWQHLSRTLKEHEYSLLHINNMEK